MKDFIDLLKLIYNRFLTRDLFSYVLPGLIIISSFVLNFSLLNNWNWSIIHKFIKNLTFFEYVLIYGLSYITGHGIQSFNMWSGLSRYSPEGDDDIFLKRIIEFNRVATNNEQEQHERFIVLKHFTINNFTAIFGGFLLFLPTIVKYLSERGSIFYKEYIFWLVFILIVFIFLMICGLRNENNHLINRQKIYEEKVIKKGPLKS